MRGTVADHFSMEARQDEREKTVLTENGNGLLAALVAGAIVVLADGLSAPASGGDLPTEVVQALKDNGAALNPVTISWETKRSSRLPLDELLQLIKQPDEKAIFHPAYGTLTCQEGKFHCNHKYTQWATSRLLTLSYDKTFDGKLFYSADNTPVSPLAVVLDLDHLKTYHPDWSIFSVDYLEAAGFMFHSLRGTIERPPESLVLYLIDQKGQVLNVREATVDSKQCLLVEVTTAAGRIAFFLDLAMQYAVRKMEKYNGNGDLTRTTVNSQFVELPSPHVWLPRRCRVSDYTWYGVPQTVPKEPIVLTDIVVEEPSQKSWPPDRFVIDFKPGTMVGDSRAKAARMPGVIHDEETGLYSYRIDPKPEDLARAAKLSKSRSRTVVVVFSGLLFVLTGILALRRYRRRHTGR